MPELHQEKLNTKPFLGEKGHWKRHQIVIDL